MKAVKKYGFQGFSATKSPRFQPDYDDEVTDEYREAVRRDIEAKKPKGVSLTPICEPGW